MRVLLLIPARGGSKGLPRKNLLTVGGISLVGRAARAARAFVAAESGLEAVVALDTDSPEIAAEGRRWGLMVPFLRAAELATDTSSSVDSTLAFLDGLERMGESFNAVILLQPTSPLRSAADISACWRAFTMSGAESAAATTVLEHPLELAVRATDGGRLEWAFDGAASVRRQECEPASRLTGAVYVTRPEVLRSRHAFVVPGRTVAVPLHRSHSVDIDEYDDVAVAEALAAGRSVSALQVGSRRVGAGHPCLVIAEAGVNHNGNPSMAHALIDAAADAGADAVKFQTFEPSAVVAPGTRKAEYQIERTGDDESQLELLQRLTLDRSVFRELAQHAKERRILFLSTAFDSLSADFLEDLDVPAFKVPSGELTNHSFLGHLASKGRPLLVSTGMSDIAEVSAALEVISRNGAPQVGLFHCVTQYPAPPKDCNLRAIETLRRAFGVPVGWSDHTEGLALSIAAVAAGATILEKHFTLNRSLPGPDHEASLEPEQMAELIRAVHAVESGLGDGRKVPAPSEAANALLVRRSLHAARSLSPGDIVGSEDLVSLRPGTGISPAEAQRIVGRKVLHRVEEGEIIREDQFV